MPLRLDDDPEAMSPVERRDEVASIFARGILRLHGRMVGDFEDLQILSSPPSGPCRPCPNSHAAEEPRARADDARCRLLALHSPEP